MELELNSLFRRMFQKSSPAVAMPASSESSASSSSDSSSLISLGAGGADRGPAEGAAFFVDLGAAVPAALGFLVEVEESSVALLRRFLLLGVVLGVVAVFAVSPSVVLIVAHANFLMLEIRWTMALAVQSVRE